MTDLNTKYGQWVSGRLNISLCPAQLSVSWLFLFRSSGAAPTCSGPEGLVDLEPSRLDSTFFRGFGAWELTLSRDVQLM